MKYNQLNESFLDGYIRYQETTKILLYKDNELTEKEVEFIDDWNQKKLIEISRDLKKCIKDGGVVYAAYDQKRVVGFTNLYNDVFFGKYINVPYLHTCRGYRSYGIGRYLLNLISVEAQRLGAKKLYISSHSSIESQEFYKRTGCVLTEEINQKLLDEEPYDIQLEKVINLPIALEELCRYEFKAYGKVNASIIGKVASKLFRYLPKNDMQFIDVIEHFISIKGQYGFFSVATLWIKKNKTIINQVNFDRFENILLEHIKGWGQVDQYCYRCLNPFLEYNNENYKSLVRWSNSQNKDVRRASLVSMIVSSNRQYLELDYEKMISIVDKLKDDEDFHVRKAVGWVLKCAYIKYPSLVERYLRDNVRNLDRMIFRYALEHVLEPLRNELINL